MTETICLQVLLHPHQPTLSCVLTSSLLYLSNANHTKSRGRCTNYRETSNLLVKQRRHLRDALVRVQEIGRQLRVDQSQHLDSRVRRSVFEHLHALRT